MPTCGDLSLLSLCKLLLNYAGVMLTDISQKVRMFMQLLWILLCLLVGLVYAILYSACTDAVTTMYIYFLAGCSLTPEDKDLLNLVAK